MNPSEHSQQYEGVVGDVSKATSAGDVDAIRRILATNPDLSECLYGYDLSGGDEDLTILKVLLEAGANINDCSFGGPLIHSLVDAIADCQGGRRKDIDWSEVGRMIELGADPLVRDGKGRTLLDVADSWGERSSLDAYLRSQGINIEWKL